MKGTTLEQLIMSYQKQVSHIVNKTSSVSKEHWLSLLEKNLIKYRPRGKAYIKLVKLEYPLNT